MAKKRIARAAPWSLDAADQVLPSDALRRVPPPGVVLEGKRKGGRPRLKFPKRLMRCWIDGRLMAAYDGFAERNGMHLAEAVRQALQFYAETYRMFPQEKVTA